MFKKVFIFHQFVAFAKEESRNDDFEFLRFSLTVDSIVMSAEFVLVFEGSVAHLLRVKTPKSTNNVFRVSLFPMFFQRGHGREREFAEAKMRVFG